MRVLRARVLEQAQQQQADAIAADRKSQVGSGTGVRELEPIISLRDGLLTIVLALPCISWSLC